jgi:aldose 1-epimerase
VTLRSGSLGVVLAPAVGGSIARFWSDALGPVLDLLRPAPDGGRDPWAMASFPLVPWSNRIRDGRFTFGGHTVTLAASEPPGPSGRHAIHGHGLRAPWTVVEVGRTGAILEYRHLPVGPVGPAGPVGPVGPDAWPTGWPWAYRATQHVTLSDERLTLELGLTNESGEPMPAGLGCHPYFPRTAETTLTARVDGLWLTDAEVMPRVLVTPPPDSDPSRGLVVDRVALDNVFTGWDGHAIITWPERRARLVIAAGPPLGCLVVYTPPGLAFFCAEPVSHVTDAFNLAPGRTDTGALTVGPGETIRGTVTFTPTVG